MIHAPNPPHQPTTLSAWGIGFLLAVPGLISAAPGDVLVTMVIPSPPTSAAGIAVDCAGNVYLSNADVLYRMTTSGQVVASVPVVDANTGSPLQLGEISWDRSRGLLWAEEDNDVWSHRVFRLDPTTGRATFVFDVYKGPPVPPLTCSSQQKRGLGYDSSDDTIWVRAGLAAILGIMLRARLGEEVAT